MVTFEPRITALEPRLYLSLSHTCYFASHIPLFPPYLPVFRPTPNSPTTIRPHFHFICKVSGDAFVRARPPGSSQCLRVSPKPDLGFVHVQTA